MCTYYTEACYAAIKSFCPKGQTYGIENYKIRSQLFILDWNENVLRRNATRENDSQLNSLCTGDKIKCKSMKKTFNYQCSLWRLFSNKLK